MACRPCSFIVDNKGCGYTCIGILFLFGVGLILQLFFVPPAVDDAFYSQLNDRIVITQKDQDDNTEAYQNWVTNSYEYAPLQLFEFWLYRWSRNSGNCTRGRCLCC